MTGDDVLTVEQAIAMAGDGGRIFSVTFRRRTPPRDVRRMVCRLGVRRVAGNPNYTPSDYGLLRVWDVQLGAYRTVPLDGVQLVVGRGKRFRFS